MTVRRRTRWVWVVVALLATVGALRLLWVLNAGTCEQYVGYPGTCTSGPVGGMPGAIAVLVVGIVVVAITARWAARRPTSP